MLRSTAAMVLAVLFFTGVVAGPMGIALLIGSIVFTAMGLTGSCPLYPPFGIKTTNP